MSKIHVAIVYTSRYGHTQRLAEALRNGVNAIPDAEAMLLTTVEAAKQSIVLDNADAIVFGSPTYMGNMASEMKLFLEQSVDRWFKRTWQDKIAGGFTNSSNFSGDKLNTLQGILIAAMQFGMIWVGMGDLASTNEPNGEKNVAGPSPKAINRNSGSLGPMASSFEVKAPTAPPEGDLETAFSYGKRIARITQQFRNGRADPKGLSPSVIQI